MAEMTYDAFLSYSHKDLVWGRWVQERMERYRLPKSLAEAEGAARRSLRVFRDQTDLAGVELQTSLQRELEASRCMIVICSPHSAVSPWVNEEIRYFKSLGRADSIIPLIVDGEPESGSPETECYPEELRNVAGQHFMGANVREIGKQKALLKVISVCLGIRFDRLADREQQRRRRTALLAGTTLFLLLAVFVGLLWRNMVTAQENERIAKENEQIALERERIALENEQMAKENERLAYDGYYSVLVSIIGDGNASPENVARVEASANAGNTNAMSLMGYIAEHGMVEGEPDPAQAFSWYMLGAEAGDSNCMAHVGLCYYEGLGVEQDYEQAFAWYLRAAEAGDMSALYYVGFFYEVGQGTEQNEAEAYTWYQRAVDQGYARAYGKLATFYLMGTGVEQDYDKAFFWVKQFAESGDPEGMAMLALCYHVGIGTEEDPRQAYLWYRRSAEAGNEDGMYWTGWCLENHFGVDSEAEEWYARAAALGQQDAIEALARLHGETDDDP